MCNTPSASNELCHSSPLYIRNVRFWSAIKSLGSPSPVTSAIRMQLLTVCIDATGSCHAFSHKARLAGAGVEVAIEVGQNAFKKYWNKYKYLGWFHASGQFMGSAFCLHNPGNDRSGIMPKYELAQTKASVLLRLLWWFASSNETESGRRQASFHPMCSKQVLKARLCLDDHYMSFIKCN
jgi:hypothetical protein